LHQVGDLFELNIKLRCQKVKYTPCQTFPWENKKCVGQQGWPECSENEFGGNKNPVLRSSVS